MENSAPPKRKRIYPKNRETHVITEADSEAKVGNCSMCGLTAIRYVAPYVPKPGIKSTPRAGYWACQTHAAEINKRNNLKRTRTHPTSRYGLFSITKTRSHYPGLTPTMIEAQFNSQEGKCAICSVVLDPKYHIDHCHATNVFRGLLCRSCNIGLGNFKDNIPNLHRAIAYLGKSESSCNNSP